MAVKLTTKTSTLDYIDGDQLAVKTNAPAGQYYNGSAFSNVTRSSGKFYFEVVSTIGGNYGLGISDATTGMDDDLFYNLPGGYAFVVYNCTPYCGAKWNGGDSEKYGRGAVAILGCYVDLDVGTIGFMSAGLDHGVAFTGVSGTFYAAVVIWNAGGTAPGGSSWQVEANFGATPFEYDPPDGYLPWGDWQDFLDGKILVNESKQSNKLDGKVVVKDTAEDSLDGRLRIYRAPVHDATKYRIDLRQLYIRHTPRAQILNTFSARYNRDWSGYEDEYQSSRALVTATDAGSVAAYGTLEGEQEGLNYVTSAGHAQAVLDWRKRELANPRLLVEFSGGYWLTQFRRGDLFRFSFEAGDELDRALLGIVESEATRFRVVDMVRRNDAAIQIQGIEVVNG